MKRLPKRFPVLFLVEDNRYSISTPTSGKTFFDLPHGHATEFLGVPTEFADGSDVFSLDALFARVVAQVRESRDPAIVAPESHMR